MLQNLVTRIALVTAAALAVAGLASPAEAAGHQAAGHDRTGTRSLAKVLAADGARLDHNWSDFDIVEQAVLAVIAAKPSSPVALLANGKVRLTAFLPTDQAFRKVVGDLTGKRPGTEKRTVRLLLKLVDLDTVETVLLYHVVAGQTLTSPKVIKAAKAGTRLTTAQGGTVKVKTRKGHVVLVDKDPDLRNPRVILSGVDINRGNKQVAHAIDRVLIPVDL